MSYNQHESSIFQTLIDFFSGIIKFLSAAAALAIVFTGISNSQATPDNYVFEKDYVRDFNVVAGKADSTVQFVYFIDLQCPACKANDPTVQEIQAEFGDRVAFVYRNYTLSDIHVFADVAARGGQAAARQGNDKYFAYKAKIYATQETLSVDNIIKSAQDSGIDMDRWNKDRQSSQILDEVRTDVRDIKAANLPKTKNRPDGGKALGTPTTVLMKDGEVFDSWTGGLSKDAQKAAIAEALI